MSRHCSACLQHGHQRPHCPTILSGHGTNEGCFQIPRGVAFKNVGTDPFYFEIEFFKYAAAPQYYVRYWHDGRPNWSCTCPDFRIRRQADRRMCKHIQACVHHIENVHLAGGHYAGFLTWHIKPMNRNLWQRIVATPVGQPLPVVGRNIRLRVQYPGDTPGYIEYTRRGGWKCRTCGGRDGRRLLKHKQCKHIACWSMQAEPYESYCMRLGPVMFRNEWNIQHTNRQAAWQRFL